MKYRFVLLTTLLLISTNLWAKSSAEKCADRNFDELKAASKNYYLGLSTSTFITTKRGSELTTSTGDCGFMISQNLLRFIDQAYDDLQEESSQGQGQHLVALASMLGCTPQSFDSFQQALQQSYGGLYGQHSKRPQAYLNQVHKMVQNNEMLRNTCKI